LALRLSEPKPSREPAVGKRDPAGRYWGSAGGQIGAMMVKEKGEKGMITQDEMQHVEPLAAEWTTDVVIIGAGLVGPFVAGMLAKRGYRVIVVDYRPDPELATYPDVRKLHIGLSTRGLTALGKHGLIEAIENVSVKMYGRRVYVAEAQTDYYPYSFDKSQCLFTLSREDLTHLFMKVSSPSSLR
jgi:hypothetical protein